MKKKAQITIFLLLGLVVLGFFVFLAYFISEFSRATEVETRDIDTLKTYVEGCIKHTGSYGLFKIGRQGGYITPPEKTYIRSYATLSYAFSEHKNTLPDLDFIEKELENYIDNNLPACLNDFEEFKNQGLTVEPKHITTDVKFTTTDVILDVHYPLKVIEGNKKTKISDFKLHVPVRIRRIHEISDDIAERKILNPEYIDLTFLGDVDVNTTVMTYDDGVQVFVIEDPKSELEAHQYKFMFASEMQ